MSSCFPLGLKQRQMFSVIHSISLLKSPKGKNKTKVQLNFYQQENMWLRRNVLVSRGSSDFFTFLLSAWRKHCNSRASMVSVDIRVGPGSHQTITPPN